MKGVSMSDQEARFAAKDFTMGDLNAVVKFLGEEATQRIKSGHPFTLTFLEEQLRTLFDKNGRRIPEGLTYPVRDPDRSYFLQQPQIDYAQRLERLKVHFRERKLPISPSQFQDECEGLREELAKSEEFATCANILNGVVLPVVLLPVPHRGFDYGMVLERVYLSAVERAYKELFPERTFQNNRKGELARKVSIIDGSRHDLLVGKLFKGPVIGLFSPNPLQGFSVLAQREQMATLPQRFSLGGGFDSATAVTMYPDVLARDFQTPGYDCAALSWVDSEYSLCFEANDERLWFDHEVSLGYAFGSYSGGLFFSR